MQVQTKPVMRVLVNEPQNKQPFSGYIDPRRSGYVQEK